jgi:hypothetical protein
MYLKVCICNTVNSLICNESYWLRTRLFIISSSLFLDLHFNKFVLDFAFPSNIRIYFIFSIIYFFLLGGL